MGNEVIEWFKSRRDKTPMVVERLAGRFGRYANPEEEEDGENHEQNRPMEEG